MRFAWVTTVAVLVFVANVPAAPDATQLHADARRAEGRCDWPHALELYGKLLVAGDESSLPHWHLCARRLQQRDRWDAPDYRPQLETLSLPAALELLDEALSKLIAHAANRKAASTARLYHGGIAELDWLLRDPVTRDLVGVDPVSAAAFRDFLRDQAAPKAAELRDSVRRLAVAGQQALGLAPGLTVAEWLAGALAAVDDHTRMLQPGAAELPGSYRARLEALGLTVNWRAGRLTVEAVQPGSWAASVGVQPGERVVRLGRLALDGPAMPSLVALNAAGSDASDIVFGEMGRTLSLPRNWPTVGEPLPVTSMTEPMAAGKFLIAIRQFTQATPDEFESAILQARTQGLRSLILDLRGNPGGSLQAAVGVADKLLPAGTVALTVGDGRNSNQTLAASGQATVADVPLVVLIDAGTASAAEVLASALKENGRARLIGQPTRGKGTVQGVFALKAGTGIKLTLARLFTSNGQPLSGGVTPHDEVAGREAQLLAAVEALRGTMRD